MRHSGFPRRTHTGSQISTKGNRRKLSESTRYTESVGLAIAYEVRERINVPIIARRPALLIVALAARFKATTRT